MKKTIMLALVLIFGISVMGISTAIACCEPVGTGTPGYWKNHPEAWPVDEICFMGFAIPCVSKADALDMLDAPVKGDKWLTMFKAYAAAYLNVEIGNCAPICTFENPGDVSLYSVAYWLVDTMNDRPVRGPSDAWQYSHGEFQYECLDDYNNGLHEGIPSRDALE